MPIYLNGYKCIGAYKNGQRINGYMQGHRLFDYRVNVTVTLTNPWTETTMNIKDMNGNLHTLHFPETQDRTFTQTLYNVPVTVNNFNQLYNYGLYIPNNYHLNNGDDNFAIDIADGDPTASTFIYPNWCQITWAYNNTHRSYKPYETDPSGGKTACFTVGYGCSFNLEELVTAMGVKNNLNSKGWSEDIMAGNGDTHVAYGDAYYNYGLYPNNDF